MVRIVQNLFLRLRLEASSLIEVTTALVIISMVFGLAITIYLNVQRTGFSSRKLMYALILEEVRAMIDEAADKGKSEYNYDDVIVYQEIAVHPSNSLLLVIRLEARNEDGKVLMEKKYLKYASPEE